MADDNFAKLVIIAIILIVIIALFKFLAYLSFGIGIIALIAGIIIVIKEESGYGVILIVVGILGLALSYGFWSVAIGIEQSSVGEASYAVKNVTDTLTSTQNQVIKETTGAFGMGWIGDIAVFVLTISGLAGLGYFIYKIFSPYF